MGRVLSDTGFQKAGVRKIELVEKGNYLFCGYDTVRTIFQCRAHSQLVELLPTESGVSHRFKDVNATIRYASMGNMNNEVQTRNFRGLSVLQTDILGSPVSYLLWKLEIDSEEGIPRKKKFSSTPLGKTLAVTTVALGGLCWWLKTRAGK